ncbi:MAG: glycosyltransferase [Actinobacteria bacterium]|nr:glycosyltransferase [Actinomycetota bacterium]
MAFSIAYLSLQAVVDGQDTWAAVTEIIRGLEECGWSVDRYFVDYPVGATPGAIGRTLEMLRVQRRLAGHLRDYDALYVRAHPFAWPTAFRALRTGVPLVQECNGPYEDLFIAWPITRFARPLFVGMMRWQYRRASAVISVAQGLSQWLREETGHDRIVTNGNGANTVIFSPNAPRRAGLPPKFAVFFGQFPSWQGIGTLLEAVRLPNWPEGLPMVFVGDGMMRAAVETAAAETPDKVVYLGRLPYAEVAGVVAHSAVSFVPMVAPERETMFSPLKLYESMACGVPVVASDVIGVSEVVNEHQCGVLVTPGDAEGIANAAAWVAQNPDEACAMGARGRDAAVSRYSWRARSQQRREIVEDAVERMRTTGATRTRD